MAKEEWGTKRTCPKCSARFYDLGNDTPVVCIECGESWKPEPILKSKQPIAEVKKEEKSDEKSDASDSDADDLDVAVEGEEEVAAALGIEDNKKDDSLVPDASLDDEDDAEVSGMVDSKLTDTE